MAGGMYTLQVQGVLNDKKIRQQLKMLEQYASKMKIGGASGTSSTKGLTPLNKQLSTTTKRFDGLSKASVKARRGMEGYGTKAKTYMQNVGSSAEKADKKVGNIGKTFASNTKKVAMFGASTAILSGFTAMTTGVVKSVVELDGALTELRKVSDLSGKGLEDYTKKAYESGRVVARTGTEMIQASTEFRKSGFTDTESLKLAEVSSMFQNIADSEISAGDSASFVISQMKAFGYSANEAYKIIDSVNEVDILAFPIRNFRVIKNNYIG